MATKRKTKSRRGKKRRAKKGKIRWFRLGLFLIPVALILLGLAVIFFPKTPTRIGLTPDLVDSVLLAASVNLNSQKQVASNGDATLWKITLETPKQKKAILKGLRKIARARRAGWKQGKETQREHELAQVVELKLENSGLLRLILVIPLGTSTPKQPLVKGKNPLVAIIIDDIGHEDVSVLRPILDIKFPITFAVLPFLSQSTTNAIYFHQNQYEIILHMPMEPNQYPHNNPGEGAILSHFNAREIRGALQRALKEVPFASGVNNHMGSKITANRALMQPFLDEVKKGNLYFIDSRTHANTVAHALARTMGLRTAKRDVFLDAERDYAFTIRQLQQVREVAEKQGLAIAIGHPYPTTLQALQEEMPKMDRQGFRFVFASEVVAMLQDHL